MTPPFEIRSARKEDCPLILAFIQELAAYEHLADHVVGTVERLENTLFCANPRAEVVILEEAGRPAGFALFFQNYSTFLCQYGLYIEDIYVREAYRGKGYGKALLRHICGLAQARDCGRVEWWCLDWNTPAIDFYRSLDAVPMSDWTVYRLSRPELEQLAA